jgi:hypothetical protein
MAWPVLRKTAGPQSQPIEPADFPWKHLKPWMPQEQVINSASQAHHDLDALNKIFENPDKNAGPEAAALLKRIADKVDRIGEMAPHLGKSTDQELSKTAKDLKDNVGKLIPLATAYLKDRQNNKPPADTIEALRGGLRKGLRHAIPGDPGQSPRQLRFREPNLLPPPEAEPPFPWPKLRKWVQESVATAALEFEDTLKDWERIRKEGGDESLPKQHMLEGVEVLHDVLAPKMGMESAQVLRQAAQQAWKELEKPKVDLDAVRRALKPVLVEANLSDADLAICASATEQSADGTCWRRPLSASSATC